ncbi:MAG: DUF4259 domain-containing protein [Jatrophihabitans sp.]|uniref:DUF4259 domain-containing protein n=1 Tax=Jatrophihabitans sp. TaxID=1932789 RepID=UPI003F7F37E6
MGAWGSGPFDNDDAADFAGDLGELDDWSAVSVELQRAMSAVGAGGYIEVSQMSEAVAAAALVAILDGYEGGASAYRPSSEWLAAMRGGVTAAQRRMAADVLKRAFVPADNEWFELWDEADAVDDVRGSLEPYSSHLSP